MGKRKVASPVADRGSILSFLAPKIKEKAAKKVVNRVKKSSQSNRPPQVIDLCSASEPEPPVLIAREAKRIRLSPCEEIESFLPTDCSPPPETPDLGEGCSKLPLECPDLEGEEELIGGDGLGGQLNPDWHDEDSLLKRDLEAAEEADLEQDSSDDEDIILLNPGPADSTLGNCDKGKAKAPRSISDISHSFTFPAPKAKAASIGKPTAFTALMSGHAEDKAWKAAAVTEKTKFTNRKGEIRTAPFYKIMEGMPLAVDAFRYGKIPGIKAYFLTHAHSDHYTNLSGSWTGGPVYCSKTTANLIIMNLGVKPQYVKPIPYDTIVDICGVKVTMLDANHCPGSSLFLFEGPQTTPGSPYVNSPERIFRYLHCGDFRASPRHLMHPSLVGKCVDICYLDTTYCGPSHQFPAQEQVIQACSDLIRERICEGNESAMRRGVQNGVANMRSEQMIKGWLGTGAKKEEEVEIPLFGECNEEAAAELMDLDLADDKPIVTASASLHANEKLEELFEPKADLEPDLKPKVEEKFLVLVGTYSIGKERIVKGIAKAIGSKIYCAERKMRLLKCIDEDPELLSLLTDDPYGAQVHVTGLFAITRENLAEYLASFKGHYTKIIGLRPTGWTFKPEGQKNKLPSVASVIANQTHKNYSPAFLYPQRDSTETLQAYGVPYSEHSSFRELTCFCVSMNHVRIIATVNVHSETSRVKMKAWFEKWQAERKRRKEAGEPEMVPYRTVDYW